jgi:hypothetical protein
MAKIKNTGKGPRGFYDEQGEHIVVQPGDEAEIKMTEADYEKVQELLKKEEELREKDPLTKDDPPPFELSGGAGGKKKEEHKTEKK